MKEVEKAMKDLITEITKHTLIMETKFRECNNKADRIIYQELFKQLTETLKNLNGIQTMYNIVITIANAMPPLSPPIKGQ